MGKIGHKQGVSCQTPILPNSGLLRSSKALPSRISTTFFATPQFASPRLPGTAPKGINTPSPFCRVATDRPQDLNLFDGQSRLLPHKGTSTRPFWWNRYGKARNFFPGSDRMVRHNARYVTGPETIYWNKGICGRRVICDPLTR